MMTTHEQPPRYGNTVCTLTVEHDVRHASANLLQQVRANPEPRLVQHRLDHDELARVEQALVEPARAELRSLPPLEGPWGCVQRESLAEVAQGSSLHSKRLLECSAH